MPWSKAQNGDVIFCDPEASREDDFAEITAHFESLAGAGTLARSPLFVVLLAAEIRVSRAGLSVGGDTAAAPLIPLANLINICCARGQDSMSTLLLPCWQVRTPIQSRWFANG